MLPRTFLRAARGLQQPLRHLHTKRRLPLRPAHPPAGRAVQRQPCRFYTEGKSIADEKIDEITEQYATARDEFEIAAEETEKKTIYAAEDRAAAVEEMDALAKMFDAALRDTPEDVAAEIKKRIGQRIRELDEAIKGLAEKAKED